MNKIIRFGYDSMDEFEASSSLHAYISGCIYELNVEAMHSQFSLMVDLIVQGSCSIALAHITSGLQLRFLILLMVTNSGGMHVWTRTV